MRLSPIFSHPAVTEISGTEETEATGWIKGVVQSPRGVMFTSLKVKENVAKSPRFQCHHISRAAGARTCSIRCFLC